MSDAGTPITPFSDDLREYMFSAPTDVLAPDTIEIRHPAFVDDNDNPVAVRFVNDPSGDLVATLEDDAPMNAGEQVTFCRGQFQFILPESTDQGLPTCDIQVENVSGVLTPWLFKAVAFPAPIEITYRQFLTDDLSQPQFILSGLTAQKVSAGLLRVTCTAGFEDFLNKPFPATIYNTWDFPGLAR